MICAPAAARRRACGADGSGDGGESSEDGADDHPSQTGSKLASLWGDRAGTVSPRRSRIKTAGAAGERYDYGADESITVPTPVAPLLAVDYLRLVASLSSLPVAIRSRCP